MTARHLHALVAHSRAGTPRLRPRPVSVFEHSAPEDLSEPVHEHRETYLEHPPVRVETAMEAHASVTSHRPASAAPSPPTGAADRVRSTNVASAGTPQTQADAVAFGRLGTSPIVGVEDHPPDTELVGRFGTKESAAQLITNAGLFSPAQTTAGILSDKRSSIPDADPPRPPAMSSRPVSVADVARGVLAPRPTPAVIAVAASAARAAAEPPRTSRPPVAGTVAVADADADAPTVNVTIGRIELRATVDGPPEKPQPARSTGLLTLADYGAQRGRAR
jgi:hypothetical protein